MTRVRWTSIVAVAAVALADAGCNVLCNGPGCEAQWPAARLSVLRGVPEQREGDVLLDALGRYEGTLDEGSGWTAAHAEGDLLIGQPEASVVVRVADRTDVGKVKPTSTFSASGTEFGTSLVVQPAVAGGGSWDLWVGAPGADFGRGAVYLFRDAHLAGTVDGSQADVVLQGETPNDRLGARMFPCADLTGDRLPELAITAPWFAQPDEWAVQSDAPIPDLAGAVFLVRSDQIVTRKGSFSPWEVGRVWWGAAVGEGAGHSVVCDRDLDGDGLVDVAIGAPWSGGTRGRVYLLSGDPLPASGPLESVAWRVLDGPDAADWFGSALSTLTVGGEAMLAVGAPGYQNGAGRVHVYPGRELTNEVARRFAVFEPPAGRFLPDHFGRWVYTGDVDGDLLDDLVVGAPDFKAEGRNDYDSGRMWIWVGANSFRWTIGTFADDAEYVWLGDQPFQRIGRDVAVADVDADGVDDLLVPTRAADPEEGR